MGSTFSRFSVAIIGRPNVGKSTLFNRILGKRRAIVHDSPGVTRDWQAYKCIFQGRSLLLYDTPGFEEAWDRLFSLGLQGLLWVIDAQQGVTATDLQLTKWLHKQSLPVKVIANKCEKAMSRMEAIAEGSRLGFGEPILISALHGQGMEGLAFALDALQEVGFSYHAEAPTQALSSLGAVSNKQKLGLGHDPEFVPTMPTVVILGRPNVGKSTLINCCLGFERLMTGPVAGTTRDSIDTLVQWKGRPFRLVDTAGMRRQSHVLVGVEKLACQESYRALVFAHVAIVLIDAEEGITKQDLILMDKVRYEGRALIIALNKWDLVAKRGTSFKEYIQSLPSLARRHEAIPISCRTGEGLSKLWDRVIESYDQWNQRLSTSLLNRWLQDQVAAHSPPLLHGRRIKIKYMTQIKSRPPTFGLFGYEVQSLPTEYLRYLEHRLGKDFNFSSLKIICRNTRNPYDTKRS